MTSSWEGESCDRRSHSDGSPSLRRGTGSAGASPSQKNQILPSVPATRNQNPRDTVKRPADVLNHFFFIIIDSA